jgi:hypothetical protein
MTLTDVSRDIPAGPAAGGPAGMPVHTSVRPGIEGPMIMADSNAEALTQELMRQADDLRLLAGIDDRRFAGEAVRLAREAFECFDPMTHKISHEGADRRQPGQTSYNTFFRAVALNTFAKTRNPGLAGKVLDRMIAENQL